MGFSGGIKILWNSLNILVEPMATSFHKVFLKVQVNSSPFLLTALYASPTFAIRKNTWEKLANIANFFSIPWLIMDDFNEISHPNEKFGGNPPNKVKMNLFNDFLYKVGLIDLGFIGPKFTWTKCRDPRLLILTRIDRAHAYIDWLYLFPKTKVFHLPQITSDHCAILLKTNPAFVWGNKPFIFELFWISHPCFKTLTLDI